MKKNFTFHYFALKNPYASDENAEMKSRDIKADNLSEAESKFYNGNMCNVTKDVYEIEENGKTVWTQN